jgi:hypothetical protein
MLVAVSPAVDAQSTLEFQVQGVGVASGTQFYGGGVGAALRPAGHMRFGLTASIGDLEGILGGRGTLQVTYHLEPFRRRGVTPYAGGGVSMLVASDTREYLVLLLGVESGPFSPRGWFVEAGITGGVFISAGIRLRWR